MLTRTGLLIHGIALDFRIYAAVSVQARRRMLISAGVAGWGYVCRNWLAMMTRRSLVRCQRRRAEPWCARHVAQGPHVGEQHEVADDDRGGAFQKPRP